MNIIKNHKLKIFILLVSVLSLNYNNTIVAQNALNFDGVDDFVQATYIGPVGASARTVEAWINTAANASPSTGGVQQVILDWGTASTGGRFTFNLLWGNAIRIEIHDEGLSGTIPVNDGIWHHVAAVYDPNALNQYSLYVDGVLDTAANLTVSMNTGTANPIRIGLRVDNINPFTGVIDEVRVWNYARSQTEIQDDRNKEVCDRPGLISYYRCNQGVANGNNTGLFNLTDNSGNGNNGILFGFALNGIVSNWVDGKQLGATLPVQKTINVTSCGPYVSPSGNFTWTNSGTYWDFLPNITGCDTALDINLTVINVDTSVTVDKDTLIANATGATYQWLDCNMGFLVLQGYTNKIFRPYINSSYAVEVTQNGCVDTSACYNVVVTGIGDLSQNPIINIYPNPVNDHLFIEFESVLSECDIEITNIAGQRVFDQTYNNTGKVKLDLISIENGVYIMKVMTKESINSYKIILN